MKRSLSDIAEDLRHGMARERRCTLLIGAGCSKTAGIPLAAEIVADIEKRHPRAYQRAMERAKRTNPTAVRPTYGDCMAELDPGPQRDLIRGYIDNAKLNWAHVGIGSLVAEGYVDRILTTNFDPLIAQGCAVFNAYPAVYDLTMSAIKRFEDLPDKAVFHLHGQRNGFSLLNAQTELEEHKSNVKPLFDHAREGRIWIVCGYSGGNDPLFDLIKQCQRYEYALYWIGRDKEPPRHVQDLIGDQDQTRCHYVQADGADEFFLRLTNELGHFPPAFMNDPLSHMGNLLGRFTEFPLGATNEKLDLLGDAKKRIAAYKAQLTIKTEKSIVQETVEVLASGSKMESLNKEKSDTLPPRIAALVAFYEGNAFFKDADSNPQEATQLLKMASEKYADAVKTAPNMHEAFSNWGSALVELAQQSNDDDAHQLWQQAFDKFRAAIKISPDDNKVFVSWGSALDNYAQCSEGNKARELWQLAFNKFDIAVKIEPSDYSALNNWGSALCNFAKLHEGEKARQLWQQACEKCAAATKFNPDMHEAFSNWGMALNGLANNTEGTEAIRLWQLAFEKCAVAVRLKPDMSTAFYNWGLALKQLAQRSKGDEAHSLWQQAFDKYEIATQHDPDMYEAFNDWGLSLLQFARLSLADMSNQLLMQACEKFKAALEIKKDLNESLRNYGDALNELATRSEGDDARKFWLEAFDKYAAAIKIKPDMYAVFNNWGSGLVAYALSSVGDEALKIWHEAFEKYATAIKIRPGMHVAFFNWGVALSHLAERSEGAEARHLWWEAVNKFAAAIKIKPSDHEVFNNWADALAHVANAEKDSEERTALIDKAYQHIAPPKEKINPGNGAYNVACIQALRLNAKSSVEWLEQGRAAGKLPSRDYVIADKDFDGIRKTSEFQAWLKSQGWDVSSSDAGDS
jgi:tetratricopeptide (TPR) repeat protein